MKEPHTEGVAIHGDPESCGGAREGDGEALTGESAGWVLSREIKILGCRRRSSKRKATRAEPQARGDARPDAVVDPMHAWTLFARNTGDPGSARRGNEVGTPREGERPKTRMHGAGKSDEPVVPKKHANKAERTAAECVEGRGSAKGNCGEQNTPRTQSRNRVPNALDRVREAARRKKDGKFTALLHHVTPERLEHAYRAIAKRAAPGIDGVTRRRGDGGCRSQNSNILGRSTASTPRPKAGARCGSSARRDLRGGWPK